MPLRDFILLQYKRISHRVKSIPNFIKIIVGQNKMAAYPQKIFLKSVDSTAESVAKGRLIYPYVV